MIAYSVASIAKPPTGGSIAKVKFISSFEEHFFPKLFPKKWIFTNYIEISNVWKELWLKGVIFS